MKSFVYKEPHADDRVSVLKNLCYGVICITSWGAFTLVVLQHFVSSDVPHLHRMVSAASSDTCSTGMKVYTGCIAWKRECFI